MTRPIRNARDAEAAAKDALVEYGYTDAHLTGLGADHGIDIESAEIIAQVKAQASPVGVSVVRETFGIAAALQRSAACFSLADFTPAARSFADTAGIALFSFDLMGRVIPLNAHALSSRKLPRSGDAPTHADWRFAGEERRNAFGQSLAGGQIRAVAGATWGVVLVGDQELTGWTWESSQLFYVPLAPGDALFPEIVTFNDQIWTIENEVLGTMDYGIPFGKSTLRVSGRSGCREVIRSNKLRSLFVGSGGLVLHNGYSAPLMVLPDGRTILWGGTEYFPSAFVPLREGRVLWRNDAILGKVEVGVSQFIPARFRNGHAVTRPRHLWRRQVDVAAAKDSALLSFGNIAVVVPLHGRGAAGGFDIASGALKWTQQLGDFDSAWALDRHLIVASGSTLWSIGLDGSIVASGVLPLPSSRQVVCPAGGMMAIWAADCSTLAVLGPDLSEVRRIDLGIEPVHVAHVPELNRILCARGRAVVGHDLETLS